MKTISIFISSVLACRMVDLLMLVTPFGQTIVNVIFICVDLAARYHAACNDRFDRHLLYIGWQQMHTSPFRCSKPTQAACRPPGCPSTLAFQTSSTPFRPAFRTSAGSPLCPATIYTSSASISPLSWAGFFLPQFLDAVGWSLPGHRLKPDPAPLQSVRSKGSNPSSTDTAPDPQRLMMASKIVPLRSSNCCHSLTLIPLAMGLMRMITTFLDLADPHSGQRTPSGQRSSRTTTNLLMGFFRRQKTCNLVMRYLSLHHS